MSSWSKDNDWREKKSDDEGKKEQNEGRAEKKFLWPNRGLKFKECANTPSSNLEKRQSEVY
jgi:hypothetical protein